MHLLSQNFIVKHFFLRKMYGFDNQKLRLNKAKLYKSLRKIYRYDGNIFSYIWTEKYKSVKSDIFTIILIG